jgi:hypothetical protein
VIRTCIHPVSLWHMWGPTCFLLSINLIICAHAQEARPSGNSSLEQVVISEFLAINEAGMRDDDGDLCDWIELHNTGDAIVNLTDCFLTDKIDMPIKWKLPTLLMEAGEYVLIFASGKDRRDSKHPLHTNFSLNGDGEYLALVDPDGQSILHGFGPSYPKQKKDTSFGLPPEWHHGTGSASKPGFLLKPSPGAPNKARSSGKVKAVKWSHDRGFYRKAFRLKLTTSTPNARIYYTTDGSIPDQKARPYSQPLNLHQTSTLRVRAFKKGNRPSNIKTQTFLFPGDIIHQSPDGLPPVGFPYHWGRNRVDYGMDPRVVNDPDYRDEIVQGLESLPSYSIVTDMDHLFDTQKGIYANAQNDGREWERPASVELLHADGRDGFQIDCGIRIRGGFSRRADNAKHAFRLFFRDTYGKAKLQYPLFGNEGAKSFDNLDLRCSSNYAWSMGGDPHAALCRDQINRDLQLSLGHPAMRGYFCHLYINGHYWGLYNTCERPKAGYGKSYFGGKKEDYDAVKVSKDRGGIMATDGNLDAWRRIYNIARAGLKDNAAYFGLEGKNANGINDPTQEVLVDIDNVIDYAMVIFYGGNLDAAITWFGRNRWHNNWHGIRNRKSRDGFKFFIWDAEHTFLLSGMNKGLYEDRTGPFGSGEQFGSSNPQWLWQQCLDNAEFRIRASDRIHALFHDGGLLTPEPVRQIVTDRMLEIQSAVICESARWGDSSRSDTPPRTRNDDWQKEMDRILNVYIPQRSDIVLAQLFRQGIIPDFDPPSMVRTHDTLTMKTPRGTIYYTEDGTDPRQIGGSVAGSAIKYHAPLTADEGRHIKARTRYRNEWSVLKTTKF